MDSVDAGPYLDAAAHMVEGVAAATGFVPAMIAVGLFLAVALWFLMIGTQRR